MLSKLSGVLLSILVCMPAVSDAQSLTGAQKEVWGAIDTAVAHLRKGDFKKYMQLYDESYTGWWPGDPIPIGKKSFAVMIKHTKATRKMIWIEAKPFQVKVYGEYAVVHAYFMWMDKVKDSKQEKYYKEAWTFFMKRKNGKWVALADHGFAFK